MFIMKTDWENNVRRAPVTVNQLAVMSATCIGTEGLHLLLHHIQLVSSHQASLHCEVVREIVLF